MDTIICRDKKDAKKVIDNIGSEFIHDWEFIEDGKIKIYLEEGWKDGRSI